MRYEVALLTQGFGRCIVKKLGNKSRAVFAHASKRSDLKASLLATSLLLFLLALPLHAADDFFFKANELYDQGRYKESVKYYRAAIDDGRYEPFAWFNLGNALVQLGKKEVAMVAYKRTVELLPDFVKAWMLLGELYYLAESPGDAIAAYNRAIELGTRNRNGSHSFCPCRMLHER